MRALGARLLRLAVQYVAEEPLCGLQLQCLAFQFGEPTAQQRSPVKGRAMQHDCDLFEAESCGLPALDQLDLGIVLCVVSTMTRRCPPGTKCTRVLPMPQHVGR